MINNIRVAIRIIGWSRILSYQIFVNVNNKVLLILVEKYQIEFNGKIISFRNKWLESGIEDVHIILFLYSHSLLKIIYHITLTYLLQMKATLLIQTNLIYFIKVKRKSIFVQKNIIKIKWEIATLYEHSKNILFMDLYILYHWGISRK